MSELYIHLGYPKTATTTFQQHVFPRQPDIVYLGKSIPSFRYTDPALFPLIDALMTEDSVSYGGPAALREVIRIHREEAGPRPLLISSESFLHVTATDPGVVAERVKAAFSPCKVIITIREQRSLLRSFYGLHGRFGQYLFVTKAELEPFRIPLAMDHWLEINFRAAFRNLPALLHYEAIIARYSALLGKENVGVFLFEEFKQAPESYIARLADFVGCDSAAMLSLARGRHEHAGLAQGELLWWQFNRWLGRRPPGDTIERRITSQWSRWLSRGHAVRDTMSPAWDQRLQALYGPGNQRLSDLLQQPLESYGYAYG
jgi:hypothetical protein